MGQVTAGQGHAGLRRMFGVNLMRVAKLGQQRFVKQKEIQHTGQHLGVLGAFQNIARANARQGGETINHLVNACQIGKGFQGQNFGFFLLHGVIIRLFVAKNNSNKKGAPEDAFQSTRSSDLLDFVFLEFWVRME